MKTVAEILNQVRKVGVVCTERTFWKYHQLRLLPCGRKIPGQGNVVYFPDETALRLWLVHFLTKELEFSLSDVSRYPWSQFESVHEMSALERLPGEFILTAKNEYDKAKDATLRQLLDSLMKHLESATDNRGKRPDTWDGYRHRTEDIRRYRPATLEEDKD
jgi:hypothetical protein